MAPGPYTAYTAAGLLTAGRWVWGLRNIYGFIGGETDQWAPLLVQDNHFIDTPTRPGYHLTEDLVDRTIAYIRDQQQANTGRPFFTYLALGACHAPLHAPKEFIDKYKANSTRAGIRCAKKPSHGKRNWESSPKTPCLPPRNPGVEAWSDLNRDPAQSLLPATGSLCGIPRPCRPPSWPALRRAR